MPKTKGQPQKTEDANPTQSLAAQIAQNPALLAAVNSKLSGLAGHSSGYIESLSPAIKARVNALKNIQVEYTKLEAQFHKDVYKIEMKYAELFKPLFDKRETITGGSYQPTEEECHWEEPEDSDDEDDEEKAEKEQKEAKSPEDLAKDLSEKASLSEEVKGIPEFWLTSMKNVDLIGEMIQPHDEEILKKLVDVRYKVTDAATTEGEECDMGFIIEFHFDENEYFENKVLTKTYSMKSDPDTEDPFEYEGPEIVGCTGCSIDWKKGKNVTQKLVKKKQKHKGGQTRMVTKSIKNDSFFNFFDPPQVVEDEEELDEETEALLAADFEIGHFIKERLIPKAVLFFTGEAIEDDDDDDEYGSEDDDDEDDDGDDDDENDPDYKPDPNAQNEQCKQQ